MPNPNYKRPESVLVVVYTLQGEVLLLRRTRPSHFWQSVTGSLGWGESPSSAARRELYEETGIMAGRELRDLRQRVSYRIPAAWRARYSPKAHTNLEHWFALPINYRRQPRLRAAEHTDFRWLSREQALRLASSWSNRKAIRLLLNSLVV